MKIEICKTNKNAVAKLFWFEIVAVAVFVGCSYDIVIVRQINSFLWTKWWRLLLPIFLLNSFPFFIMVQVFTIPFPPVCDLCSFSQIFASRWLDTLHTWLELSSHWFDYLEQLPGIFPGLSYGVVSLRDPMFSRFIPRIIYLVDFHHCFFDLYQIWWTYRLIISD